MPTVVEPRWTGSITLQRTPNQDTISTDHQTPSSVYKHREIFELNMILVFGGIRFSLLGVWWPGEYILGVWWPGANNLVFGDQETWWAEDTLFFERNFPKIADAFFYFLLSLYSILFHLFRRIIAKLFLSHFRIFKINWALRTTQRECWCIFLL